MLGQDHNINRKTRNDMIKNAPLQQRSTGYVKWFNKKAGYGFIKLLDSSHRVDDVFSPPPLSEQEAHEEKNDIFVHFTNIRPKAVSFDDFEDLDLGEEDSGGQQPFRFLVKGEYIEFYLKPSHNPKYSFFASDVTGIFAGHIMCDMMSIRPYPSSMTPATPASTPTENCLLVLSQRSTPEDKRGVVDEPLFDRVKSKKSRRGPPQLSL